MFNKDYNFLVKLLHGAIIGNKFVPELLFDIENLITKKENKKLDIKHQIYITGLARAGTTVLLRSLYMSKKFASFTYRDMPFIISPNIWNVISRHFKSKKPVERKHNDRLLISLDSPEQFEEVFWNLKTSNDYNLSDNLKAYDVDEYNLSLYETFIKNCLIKYKKQSYLSKNNNNLLRINSLISKFPRAKFLILFRNPLDHAISLMNQHKNFSKLQKEDKFIRKYMNYLVHHEFGLNQKQMNFENKPKSSFKKDNINYWLEQWINFYGHILKKKLNQKEGVLLVNFETICNSTSDELKKITNFFSEDFFKDLPKNYFSYKSYDQKEFSFDSKLKEEAFKIIKEFKI